MEESGDPEPFDAGKVREAPDGPLNDGRGDMRSRVGDSRKLAIGNHTVVVIATDARGNRAAERWSFKVAKRQDHGIASLSCAAGALTGPLALCSLEECVKGAF